MKIPINIGIIHFIGIGGIGMSGIAEVLHNLGYIVQGSDQKNNSNTERLRKLGINVFIGHDGANLKDVEVVVVSSAIKVDNVEYIYAIKSGLPIVKRAEMLAELMRFKRTVAVAGTHGKTTTTSLVATLLAAGGADPTIINGGIINEYGSNAVLGAGEWMVVEADESDGSFLKLPADVAIVTNIDAEHLDHYGSFEKLLSSFREFIENIPFYGFATLCIDHPVVRELAKTIHTRRIITYGADPEADVRFVIKSPSIKHKKPVSTFDVIVKEGKHLEAGVLEDISLPMPGIHNVSNATAAIATVLELGVKIDDIKIGLLEFKGVKRRFTYVGEWNNIYVFDDYGHHPMEIKAVLKAARDACKDRVIAIMQPHRYTRLESLFDEFAVAFGDADKVLITPVYVAGEKPIDGINSEVLAQKIRDNGHKNCMHIYNKEEALKEVFAYAKPGDYVVCLGAGDITNWAETFADNLSKLGGELG